MLFRRQRMVAAPEGAPAGGSGGGAGAPEGVRSPATPAGGSDPFPHTSGGAPRAPGAPVEGDGGAADELDALEAEGENAIPHTRVREMRGKWESRAAAKARAEAEQELMRRFDPVLQELTQLRELAGQLDPTKIKMGVAESFLEALGVKKEAPKPQYVTREDFEKGLSEERNKLQRQQAHREDLNRATLDLQAAKQRHASYFEHFPVLEELAAAVWSTPHAVERRIGLGQIVDALVAQIEKGIGGYNKAYTERKAREAGELPITPGVTPTPGKRPDKVDHSSEGTANRAIAFLRERLG